MFFCVGGIDEMSNKRGCVLIHGFTGSPKEIEVLANHLKEQSYEVSTPMLKGHDYVLNRHELRKATWKDWIASAENGIKEMVEQYDELYLVGFSMGGLISAYLATKYPIKKLVLLSASVFYLNPKKFLDMIRQSVHAKEEWKRYFYKIQHTPITATLQFRRLVRKLVPHIHQINVPTLVIQGMKDDLVDPKSAQYIYDHIQSSEKYIYYLPESKHIVCFDCEKEKVVELVDAFFQNKLDIYN